MRVRAPEVFLRGSRLMSMDWLRGSVGRVRENFPSSASFTQRWRRRVHNSFTKGLLPPNKVSARVMLRVGGDTRTDETSGAN